MEHPDGEGTCKRTDLRAAEGVDGRGNATMNDRSELGRLAAQLIIEEVQEGEASGVRA
jgi:hypothetical protein